MTHAWFTLISDVKSKDGRQGIIFLHQLLLFNVKLCRLKQWIVSVFIYCDFILILFRPAISRNKKHDTINPMFKNNKYLVAHVPHSPHVHTLYFGEVWVSSSIASSLTQPGPRDGPSKTWPRSLSLLLTNPHERPPPRNSGKSVSRYDWLLITPKGLTSSRRLSASEMNGFIWEMKCVRGLAGLAGASSVCAVCSGVLSSTCSHSPPEGGSIAPLGARTRPSPALHPSALAGAGPCPGAQFHQDRRRDPDTRLSPSPARWSCVWMHCMQIIRRLFHHIAFQRITAI